MSNRQIISALLFLLTLVPTTTGAQCKQKNTAFKSGEYLSYNLYFNWKMVWVKAGTASYGTIQSTRNGHPAYRASLSVTSNKKADNMFILRDTITSYSTLELEPLYYRKAARENKRYTVDEVFYSYAHNKTNLRLHRQYNNGTHTWQNKTSNSCVSDMLNILLRLRSYDFSSWVKDQTIELPIATGKALSTARVAYKGVTTVKADNGQKYKCLILSYIENKDGKYKETVRFYVTNDIRHIPVRIDFFLRFGSAKAYLTSMKGVK